jgi:hypothetical protein
MEGVLRLVHGINEVGREKILPTAGLYGTSEGLFDTVLSQISRATQLAEHGVMLIWTSSISHF